MTFLTLRMPFRKEDHWCLMGLKKLFSSPMQSTWRPKRSAIRAMWASSMRNSSESKPSARTASGSSCTNCRYGAICLSSSENSNTKSLSCRPITSQSWMLARRSCVSKSSATSSKSKSMLANNTRTLRPVISRSQRKSCLVSSTLVCGATPLVFWPVPMALRIFARMACALANSCFAVARVACFSATSDFTIVGSSGLWFQSSCWCESFPRKRSQRSLLNGVTEQDSLSALSISTVWSSRK
mmetsp:Transcript_77893/g.215272  ORF Transcript_77893/g.215272 Transcript_77893/m.215272 type:complete len:241 (+) Transcript_77893:487-1209(+)